MTPAEQRTLLQHLTPKQRLDRIAELATARQERRRKKLLRAGRPDSRLLDAAFGAACAYLLQRRKVFTMPVEFEGISTGPYLLRDHIVRCAVAYCVSAGKSREMSLEAVEAYLAERDTAKIAATVRRMHDGKPDPWTYLQARIAEALDAQESAQRDTANPHDSTVTGAHGSRCADRDPSRLPPKAA